jgi:FKBP-type peptidyl-prolyl cis-trans isomerase
MRRVARFLVPFSLFVLLGCAKKDVVSPVAAPPPAKPAAPPVAAPPSTEAAPVTTEAPALTPSPPAEPTHIPAPEDVAAPPKDAKRTPSGLASKLLAEGTGKEHPTANDRVKVHYTGWTSDGKLLDSSVERGQPVNMAVIDGIKGWTEGLQLMVAGEKRRLWIPAKLAYGEGGARPGVPAGDLTFDVELIEILAAPKVPENVKAAPKDAKRTVSGLSYKVLTKGTGTVHPKPTDSVTVHYSGWTTDGNMFDSSVTRGDAATFPLEGVIKGWSEGVQLMVEGEKTRFWIPGALAYGNGPGRPGVPAGTLVFDIELIHIR